MVWTDFFSGQTEDSRNHVSKTLWMEHLVCLERNVIATPKEPAIVACENNHMLLFSQRKKTDDKTSKPRMVRRVTSQMPITTKNKNNSNSKTRI